MISEISQKCPKCKKDYSGDPHWKNNLKKHLSRKNPCDRKKNEKYVRNTSSKQSIQIQTDERDDIELFKELKIKLQKREFMSWEDYSRLGHVPHTLKYT
jgi:hypothetical protein